MFSPGDNYAGSANSSGFSGTTAGEARVAPKCATIGTFPHNNDTTTIATTTALAKGAQTDGLGKHPQIGQELRVECISGVHFSAKKCHVTLKNLPQSEKVQTYVKTCLPTKIRFFSYVHVLFRLERKLY